MLQKEAASNQDMQARAAEEVIAYKHQIRTLKLEAKVNAAYKEKLKQLFEEV